MRWIALLAFVPAILLAQETQTERDAAREVMQKMGALEKSVDAPGWVERLTGANPGRDQVTNRAKQLLTSELMAMADDITRHPEIGFTEKRTVGIMVDYLRAHNFDVQVGLADLPTSFIARWKGSHGAPNVAVLTDYDALRGTEGAFHGDQHSTQGPIGIAAALAIVEYLERSKAPGSVTIVGSPGEEMMPPNAKTLMFNAGVFKGIDVIVRTHSTNQTSRPAAGFGTCCYNIDGVKYIFSGAPSHQMTAWSGRNALEAVIHLFNNIDSVRSNIRPEAKIQGIITEGGAAPNVVPDRAVADFYIRYPDEVYLKQVREFVDNAARAAALSTGTKLKIDNYGRDRDGIGTSTLYEVAFGYLKKYGAKGVTEVQTKPQGHEETGSVSSAIPGLTCQAMSSTWPNHTYGMLDDALTDVGHSGFIVDTQCEAAMMYDYLTNAAYREAVTKEFVGLQNLHAEYLTALVKAYPIPPVPDPK